jgi:hypothetical protein
MKKFKVINPFILALFIWALGMAGTVRGQATFPLQSLALAWDVSASTNVVSYIVTETDGTNMVTQSIPAAIPPATNTVTFTNLLAGRSYTFTAISVNDVAIQSVPSLPLVYTVPLPFANLPAFNPTRGAVINAPKGTWTIPITWPMVSVKAPYGFTNYFVNVISPTSTNSFATLASPYLLSVPVDDLIISVTATNLNGPSPINSVLVLSKAPPSSPALRITPR